MGNGEIEEALPTSYASWPSTIVCTPLDRTNHLAPTKYKGV